MEKREVTVGKRVLTFKRHRRAHLDIMEDILRVAVGGTKKTHLMYRCNLSFTQSKIYLRLLVRKGLLRPVFAKKSSPGNLFETTDKGKKFLRTYRDLKAVLTT